MIPCWHEEAINRRHRRDAFDCGEEALNTFLRHHARQSHERGGAKTFLAINDVDNEDILGYYSLSPASVEYQRTPEVLRRGLARHDVPGFRLARLAVHKSYKSLGLGGQLLLAAGRRCILASAEVGGVVLLIDAKSEKVAGWYQSYGAIPLQDRPQTLVMSLETIRIALQQQGKL